MDSIIQFFQDLMTLFFGAITLCVIAVLIVLLCVEIYDFVTGNDRDELSEEED